MNARVKFSVVLLCMGLILALLPLSSSISFNVRPGKLLSELLDEKTYYSVDQVARFLVTEDSTVQIIDLRSLKNTVMKIPGSINIPYSELLDNDPGSFLE